MTLTVPDLSGALAYDADETLIGTLAPTGGVGPYEVVAVGAEAATWFAAWERADQHISGTWRVETASPGAWRGVDALAGRWREAVAADGAWR